jgi:uncharacterized protein (DUF4415 family)
MNNARTGKTSRTKTSNQTDWARVRAQKDADIAHDPDSPRTKAKDWQGAFVARSHKELNAKLTQRRGRGPQKAPTKVQLSLRLAPEVVAYFRSSGPGWQTRMAEVLAAHIR